MALSDDIYKKMNFAILVKGSFTPDILQPFWLKEKGFISEGDISGNIVVNNDVTNFKTTYFSLNCTREQFYIETTNIDFREILVETVRGIFTILTAHPISELGLRSDVHYNLKSADDRNNIFKKLSNYNSFNGLFKNPNTSFISMFDTISENEVRRVQASVCSSNPNHIQLFSINEYNMKTLFHENIRSEQIPNFLELGKVEDNIQFSLSAFEKMIEQ